MRLAWLFVVVVTAGSCGKAPKAICETACRSYATLAFWDKWDPLINAEPEAQRDKLRRDKLGDLEAILARGIDQCVQSCQYSNNKEQYPCMAKAKTFKEARSCAETEEESQ